MIVGIAKCSKPRQYVWTLLSTYYCTLVNPQPSFTQEILGTNKSEDCTRTNTHDDKTVPPHPIDCGKLQAGGPN